jgi:hypothetical protein
MPTSTFAAGIATNDILLSYAPEATWGVKPAVQFNQIRVESEGFSSSKSRTRPGEINATGQVSQAVTQKIEAKGDMKFALQRPFRLICWLPQLWELQILRSLRHQYRR